MSDNVWRCSLRVFVAGLGEVQETHPFTGQRLHVPADGMDWGAYQRREHLSVEHKWVIFPILFLREPFLIHAENSFNSWMEVLNYYIALSLSKFIGEWNVPREETIYVFSAFADVPFPSDFRQTCKKILSRLFRIFVHVYIHHFDRLVQIGAVIQLFKMGSCFYRKVCLGASCEYTLQALLLFRHRTQPGD